MVHFFKIVSPKPECDGLKDKCIERAFPKYHFVTHALAFGCLMSWSCGANAIRAPQPWRPTKRHSELASPPL